MPLRFKKGRKKMKNFLKISLVAAMAACALNAANYEVDAVHSNVGFIVKHLSVSKVNGNFKSYKGAFEYDAASNELKSMEAVIDVNSVNTQNDLRDKHLKSDDFFGAEKFKEIKFKMNKFEKEGKNDGKIYGDLTIRNVTKPVVLDFEFNGEGKNQKGEAIAGVSLEGEILRKDFGVGMDSSEITLSNKIKLQIELEAVAK